MSKTIHAIVLISIGVLVSACQSQSNSVSEGTSADGMPYTLVSMPGSKRVSIQIAWPSDWLLQEDKNPAIPQVATRVLLAGGAKGYAVEEVVERMKDINSEAYLAAGTNYIFGTLHYSKEHQDETLGIANAHLVSPAVDESWLVRIRDSFSEGIKASRSSGEVQAFNAMRWSLLGDQPLREFLSLDNDDNINRVSVSDVKDWVSSTLVRRGVHVVVAGDMDTDAAGRVVDTLFTGLKDASVEEVDKNTMNFPQAEF